MAFGLSGTAIAGIAIAAGTVASGVMQSKAAGNAASAQQAASAASDATQYAMYNQTRADQAPWRTGGGQAVNALSQFYG